MGPDVVLPWSWQGIIWTRGAWSDFHMSVSIKLTFTHRCVPVVKDPSLCPSHGDLTRNDKDSRCYMLSHEDWEWAWSQREPIILKGEPQKEFLLDSSGREASPKIDRQVSWVLGWSLHTSKTSLAWCRMSPSLIGSVDVWTTSGRHMIIDY